jgi:hypothetical protein
MTRDTRKRRFQPLVRLGPELTPVASNHGRATGWLKQRAGLVACVGGAPHPGRPGAAQPERADPAPPRNDDTVGSQRAPRKRGFVNVVHQTKGPNLTNKGEPRDQVARGMPRMTRDTRESRLQPLVRSAHRVEAIAAKKSAMPRWPFSRA